MEHARLSASGSDRWSSCPGSVALEENIPEPKSDFADEGNCAHHIAGEALKNNLNAHAEVSIPEPLQQYDSPEMREYVQQYLDFARALPGEHFYEQRVDYSDWVQDGFGTSDCIKIADGTLYTADLKYGKGVQVFAEENTQMILYALGALAFARQLYDNITLVKMYIVQPRLDHIDPWEITVEKLLEWGEYLRTRADETLKPDAPRIPSKKACRFCRAKAVCPERAQANIALAVEEFGELPKAVGLNLVELASIFSRLDDFDQWSTDIREHCLSKALAGYEFPDLKLVEGRSNRKWNDPVGAVTFLKELGFVEKEFLSEPELKGITAINALVKAKEDKEQLNAFCIKPPGKPVLVPVTDKRPVYSPKSDAVDDFTNASPEA